VKLTELDLGVRHVSHPPRSRGVTAPNVTARGAGSLAVAVRVERLYVLTWISAWCGVFLGFDRFSLPHPYQLVPPLRKYHVFEYLYYRTRRYEYRTMKSDHSCVAPLLPSESSQVWANSPDSVGVASSSGVICHLRTLFMQCQTLHPEIDSLCNVSTTSREPACMGNAPSQHRRGYRRRDCNRYRQCVTHSMRETPGTLFPSSLQHLQQSPTAITSPWIRVASRL
jgi:hypothetical protein